MIPNETDMNLIREWWAFCEYDECSHWSHAVCKPGKFPHIWGPGRLEDTVEQDVDNDDSSLD